MTTATAPAVGDRISFTGPLGMTGTVAGREDREPPLMFAIALDHPDCTPASYGEAGAIVWAARSEFAVTGVRTLTTVSALPSPSYASSSLRTPRPRAGRPVTSQAARTANREDMTMTVLPRCPFKGCPVRYRGGPDRLCPEHQREDGGTDLAERMAAVMAAPAEHGSDGEGRQHDE